MLYTYTAVISESDGTFYAKVPDVSGCITTASSLSEAIKLITDALNLCLVELENEGIKPAPATPQSDIPYSPDDMLTIIWSDTIKYRSVRAVNTSSHLYETRNLFQRPLRYAPLRGMTLLQSLLLSM